MFFAVSQLNFTLYSSMRIFKYSYDDHMFLNFLKSYLLVIKQYINYNVLTGISIYKGQMILKT